ncbi:hypothetical protein Q1695_015252 [Nippostrongylus brasiliensis]|nr:hypothetical protein Q1695_015252 [Nippostrongylus brasiliensis]
MCWSTAIHHNLTLICVVYLDEIYPQNHSSRSSKRVSINDDEARSELSRRSFDRQLSDFNCSSSIDAAVLSEDASTFVRDIIRREFPNGDMDVVECSHEQGPVETTFNKTLRLRGKGKTVFIHFRNHVSSNSDVELGGKSVSNTNGTFEPVEDSTAHTNASSWTGPHLPTAVPCTLSSLSFERSFSTPPRHDGPHQAAITVPDHIDSTEEEVTAEVLERKILGHEYLSRSDFLALKAIHCGQVADKEEELQYLRNNCRYESDRIQNLQNVLENRYETYEEILESVRPIRQSSSVLAHRILLADAYLFHARLKQSKRRAQRRLYQMSLDIYSELFSQAKRSLSPADLSLLSIVEKISSILRESRCFHPELIVELTEVLDNAEEDSRRQPFGEQQRKVQQARQNLGALGAYYYLDI